VYKRKVSQVGFGIGTAGAARSDSHPAACRFGLYTECTTARVIGMPLHHGPKLLGRKLSFCEHNVESERHAIVDVAYLFSVHGGSR
jgi:hypothetical protein